MVRFRVSVPRSSFREAKAVIYDHKINFESFWNEGDTRKIQFRSAENMGKLVDKLQIRRIDYEIEKFSV